VIACCDGGAAITAAGAIAASASAQPKALHPLAVMLFGGRRQTSGLGGEP
jgi:hypothetical protein